MTAQGDSVRRAAGGSRRSRRAGVLLALLATVGVVAGPARGAEPQAATPLRPSDAVLQALRSHPLVAIGEDHGLATEHRVIREVLRDRRVVRRLDAIVVEFGNARYQRRVDRFVAGKPVPLADLRAVWRDSIGGGPLGTWDAPIYERFFVAVRRLNRRLPAGQRLRIILADPPFDWTHAARASLERVARTRDAFYAKTVEREVLLKRKRALLIAGLLHFLRGTSAEPPPGADAPAPATSALQILDRRHPGATFLIALPMFSTQELQRITAPWPAPAIAFLAGTDLGALRPDVPPGAPPPGSFEQTADAYLHLGTGESIRYSTVYPSAYRDRAWREQLRRLPLVAGDARPDELLGMVCSYASVEGRGIPQASRGFGPGEDPTGTGAGPDPTWTSALEGFEAAFAAHRLVAVGNAPQLHEEMALLAALVRQPWFAKRVGTIAADFLNPRYQSLIDRYVAGRPVRSEALASAWRETSQLVSWDVAAYRDFLATVRAVNRRLSAKARVRIVAVDAPMRWERIRSQGDYRRQAEGARSVLARALADGERSPRATLLIALRGSVVRYETPVADLERRAPGSTWVVLPHAGFAPHASRLEARLADLPGATLLSLRSSWLGATRAGANASPRAPSRALGEVADAYLWLGPKAGLTAVSPPASVYRNRYWNALRRRYRARFGKELAPAQAFPTSDCVQGGGAEPSGPPEEQPGGGSGA